MVSLPEAVEKVEALDLVDQRLLRDLLTEAVYMKVPFHKLKRGENFDVLIASGLAVRIDEPAGVVLSDDLEKVRRKLCTYLNRRNEVEHFIDENMVEHEIPKGAKFFITVTIGGDSDVSLRFPDDEITELLDKHGVNRCRTGGYEKTRKI